MTRKVIMKELVNQGEVQIRHSRNKTLNNKMQSRALHNDMQ